MLTASGGPFRGRTRAELAEVTPEQAMAHPTWAMGPVVTINSATLVNKGLEVIEAHLLFDVPMERIDVVVHPQSVVHSMVEFVDGSTLAQASPPDMRLPIALGPGLAGPGARRGTGAATGPPRTTWTFEPLDDAAFPAVALARAAGTTGGPRRRSSTRPTRWRWRRSGPAGCPSWGSSTPIAAVAGRPRPGAWRRLHRGRPSWPRTPGRAARRPLDDHGGGRRWEPALYLLGVLARGRRHRDLDRPARGRPHGAGQAVRREGHRST